MSWVNPKHEATYSKVPLVDRDDSSDFENDVLSEIVQKRSQRNIKLMNCVSARMSKSNRKTNFLKCGSCKAIFDVLSLYYCCRFLRIVDPSVSF